MTSKQKTRALLVCIDGADGTGKSSVIADVMNKLQKENIIAISTKEPYDDGITYKIIKQLQQEYIANRDNETERKLINRHLVMALSLNRSIHMNSVWKSLWSGDLQVVIMDRGYYSTLVYQGILEGDEKLIELIDDIHDDIDIADLTFITTCKQEEQERRLKSRGSDDPFDQLAKQALIGYENLVYDFDQTKMYQYSKAFQIKKRCQLTMLPTDVGNKDDVSNYIVSMIKKKLTYAKYDVFGKNTSAIEEPLEDDN